MALLFVCCLALGLAVGSWVFKSTYTPFREYLDTIRYILVGGGVGFIGFLIVGSLVTSAPITYWPVILIEVGLFIFFIRKAK